MPSVLIYAVLAATIAAMVAGWNSAASANGRSIFACWGTLAPVGTLIWWLNQSAESLGIRQEQRPRSSTNNEGAANKANPIRCYIIFLPGVGDFSADQLTAGEELFLERLVQQHPGCVAVADVFPYSAANESLGGRRPLAPLWNAIEHAEGWLENADVLIKIRNLWRFAISADDRYGPVYNRGIAAAIIDRMNAAHPIQNDQQQPLKLILIGTSGGAQVALGAVPYLEDWLNAQLIVVSVGGVFPGTTGFDQAEQVYHLQGDRDWIEDLSWVLFPSRWAWTVRSPFNRSKQEERYSVHSTGSHAHDGDKGYFGLDQIENGNKTYVELTLDRVNQLPIW
jgi:hypothetical protein